MKHIPMSVKLGRQYASEMRAWRKRHKMTIMEFAVAVGCCQRKAEYISAGGQNVGIVIYRRFEALKKRYEEAKSGNTSVRRTRSSAGSASSFEPEASYFG